MREIWVTLIPHMLSTGLGPWLWTRDIHKKWGVGDRSLKRAVLGLHMWCSSWKGQ